MRGHKNPGIEVAQLAIKVKVLQPPKLNLLERLYLPEIMRGLWTTFKHLFFVKSITVQYPEEVKQLPPRYRGLHVLPADDEGKIRCVRMTLVGIGLTYLDTKMLKT